MRRPLLVASVFGAWLAAPVAAFAGNGLEPRTPVDWPDDGACLTVVDRAQAAMLHMAYAVPYEDVDVTMDEVEDSRTHQFIAFCRDHSREEFLPVWLSWKDVDAAAAKGLMGPTVLDDEDVLETSTVWKDCWYRITPDETRRPITFAEALKGVDWDTSALPAGAYVVQGYTWEPWVNIYAQRPGVVHVVDGPDLSAAPPAAAVSTAVDYAYADEPYPLDGCARALPGSTLSAYWSHTGTLDWQEFAADVPLVGETFTLPFLPPTETIGKIIALRVDVTDPMQRTFSAYPLFLTSVLPASSGGEGSTGCDPEASFIVNPCATGEDTGASPTTSSAAATGGAEEASTAGTGATSGGAPADPDQEPGADGCSCTPAPSGLAWVGCLGLLLRRRRA